MASTTRALYLRDAQRSTIRTVLNCSTDATTKNTTSTPWRVLIVDEEAKTIIDTIITTSELRKHNITLTLPLEQERKPLPNVPAIYVVSPTPENIARVLRDIDGYGSGRRSVTRLYPHATIGFTAPCPKPLLAALATQCKLPSRITQIHDTYSNFIALERDAFELRMSNSYINLHSTNTSLRETAIDSIVSGLFCVLASLRVIPIIRSQRFGPAEQIARKLTAKFREFLDDFSQPLSFKRPLLLLFDRDFDLTPILHHTWIYQPLVEDCLNYQRNFVSLSVKSNDSNSTKKNYRLDKDSDSFWTEQANRPFPAVAEAIESALAKYRTDVDAINRKASVRSGEANDEDDSDDYNDGASSNGLVSAISSLPELSRRKEELDIHTNIGSALIEQIEKRKLDTFFEFETSVLDSNASQRITQSHAKAHLNQLSELLRVDENQAQMGTKQDRARAVCLYYIVFGNVMNADDASELKTIVDDSGVDTNILVHIRRVCGFHHDNVKSVEDSTNKPTSWKRPSLRGMMSSVVKKGYHGIASFAQSAKTLMTERGISFLTVKTLELFLNDEVRSEEDDKILDEFLYLDPKMDEDVGGEQNIREARRRKRRTVFDDAVVFVCGGGNCVEMTEFAKFNNQYGRVLYGCSEMCNGDEFVRQLYSVAANFK